MSTDSTDGQDWAAPGSPTPPPGWSAEQPPPAPSWEAPAQARATDGWGAPYAPPPPPQPGIVPLRPLGVGELLDGAFTAIRRYPRATLGLAAGVMLVVTVVNVLTQWYLLSGIEAPRANETLSQAGGYVGRVATVGAIDVLVTLLATLVLSGLITAVIGEAVLGRPVTPAQAWQRVRPLVWRLIGVSVLTFLIVAVVSAVLLLPGILAAVAGGGTGAAILFIVGGIGSALVGIYTYISLALAPNALVLENQTVRGALRRSRALVKGSWWRVFWILLLANIIASVVGGIISLPFGLAGGGLSSIGGQSSSLHFSQLVVSGIGSLLSSTLVRPFSAGVAALLYIDRRIRAEALDVTLARAAAESTHG